MISEVQTRHTAAVLNILLVFISSSFDQCKCFQQEKQVLLFSYFSIFILLPCYEQDILYPQKSYVD